MTDPAFFATSKNLTSTCKSAQSASLLDGALSSVLKNNFDSAAACFESFLVLLIADEQKFGYTQEQVLAVKFAICCCYYFSDKHYERNLQLLKEIEIYREQIPAIHYIKGDILFKLNMPSLSAKSIETGMEILSRSVRIKHYYWPETAVPIELTEINFLRQRLEELKKKLHLTHTFVSDLDVDSFQTENIMQCDLNNRFDFNVEATKFIPESKISGIVSSMAFKQNTVVQENTDTIKNMLKKQAELLEEMRSEQSQYKTVKTTMEKQQRVYEKKIRDLEERLSAKDKIIASLSANNLMAQEVREGLMNCVRSVVTEQANLKLEEIRVENGKLKNIISQFIERYFAMYLSISKSSEMFCFKNVENLNTLLQSCRADCDINLREVEDEIKAWNVDLDSIKKKQRIVENTRTLITGNTLEDGLMVLSNLSENSIVHMIDKRDVLQKFYLKKCVGTENDNSSVCSEANLNGNNYDPENKDWKYHLHKHRNTITSQDIFNIDKNKDITPKDENKITTNHRYTQESWIEREISRLSERVKLIGGPNYWRLIVYIKDKMPMVSEDSIVDAVEAVRASHGKLNGLSRDTIFNEARGVIESKKRTKNVKFPLEGAESMNCTICCETFDISNSGILTCGHRYHKSCIQEWLQKEPFCPICRAFTVPQEYRGGT